MNSSTPGTSGQGSSSSFNACLPCRRIKMKCRLSPDAITCDRCVRKSLDCQFQQHRRGRKLGTRVNTLLPNTRNHPADVDSITETHSEDTMPASLAQEHVRGASVGLPSRRQPNEPEPARREFWADSDGFQPPSLLNRQAARGNFSLQNVLSTSPMPTAHATSSPSENQEDPICKGLLNHAIASSLYQGFGNVSQAESVLC